MPKHVFFSGINRKQFYLSWSARIVLKGEAAKTSLGKNVSGLEDCLFPSYISNCQNHNPKTTKIQQMLGLSLKWVWVYTTTTHLTQTLLPVLEQHMV